MAGEIQLKIVLRWQVDPADIIPRCHACGDEIWREPIRCYVSVTTKPIFRPSDLVICRSCAEIGQIKIHHEE